MPLNLWTFIEDYETGGFWYFYQNGGANNGTGSSILDPNNISNDGIYLSDLNNNSQFEYCVGVPDCVDCEVINVNVTNCSDDGPTGCSECAINIIGVTVQCVGSNVVQICVKYQANECAIPSADGGGWTIGAAFFNDGVNTQIGNSHGIGNGFQLDNTGAVNEVCWQVMIIPPFDQINFTFTDANTNNDTRGCLSNGTGQGSGAFIFNLPNTLNC